MRAGCGRAAQPRPRWVHRAARVAAARRRCMPPPGRAHGVRVVLLCVDAAVLYDELKGKVHEAAVAAVVALAVAVHQQLHRRRGRVQRGRFRRLRRAARGRKPSAGAACSRTDACLHTVQGAGSSGPPHLLRQGVQLAGDNGAGTLDCAGGGEGPAGAAQQLVLDLRGRQAGGMRQGARWATGAVRDAQLLVQTPRPPPGVLRPPSPCLAQPTPRLQRSAPTSVTAPFLVQSICFGGTVSW